MSADPETATLRIYVDSRDDPKLAATLLAAVAAVQKGTIDVVVKDGKPQPPPPTPHTRDPKVEQQETEARVAAGERLDAKDKKLKRSTKPTRRPANKDRGRDIASARSGWRDVYAKLKELGIVAAISVVIRAGAAHLAEKYKH